MGERACERGSEHGTDRRGHELGLVCFIHSQATLFMNEHTYYVTHRRQRVFLYRPRGRTLDYAFLAGYTSACFAPRGPFIGSSFLFESYLSADGLRIPLGFIVPNDRFPFLDVSRRIPLASIAITDSLSIDNRCSQSALERLVLGSFSITDAWTRVNWTRIVRPRSTRIDRIIATRGNVLYTDFSALAR